VSGNKLLRKLRRLADRQGAYFTFDPSGGKGGHGTIKFGERETTLRSSRQKEIPRGTLRKMLSQLGITPQDL
jgi:hypothetical protein